MHVSGHSNKCMFSSVPYSTYAHQVYDPLLEQEGRQVRRRLICSVARQHGDDLGDGSSSDYPFSTSCVEYDVPNHQQRRGDESGCYAQQMTATHRLNVKPPVIAVSCNMSPPACCLCADRIMSCTKAAAGAVQAVCAGAGRHESVHVVTARNMCTRLQGRHGRHNG